jgi:hypothetical protein
VVWSFEEQPCVTASTPSPASSPSQVSCLGVGSSAGARYSRRFADRQGFIVNPTSRSDETRVWMMVKEAIETQNKTTLFSKPNSGFNAVMFLTQVPPAHLMSLSLLRSTSVPFAPKLLVWKASYVVFSHPRCAVPGVRTSGCVRFSPLPPTDGRWPL